MNVPSLDTVAETTGVC